MAINLTMLIAVFPHWTPHQMARDVGTPPRLSPPQLVTVGEGAPRGWGWDVAVEVVIIIFYFRYIQSMFIIWITTQQSSDNILYYLFVWWLRIMQCWIIIKEMKELCEQTREYHGFEIKNVNQYACWLNRNTASTISGLDLARQSQSWIRRRDVRTRPGDAISRLD